MADSKISALTALASADPTDVLPIVDVSAGVTKKITKSALLTAAQKTLTFADSPYAVLSTDETLFSDVIGGDTIVNFPLAASFPGRVLIVKKIDVSGNKVSPTASGADLIEGVAAANISTQNEGYQYQSDGVSNWWIIAKMV